MPTALGVADSTRRRPGPAFDVLFPTVLGAAFAALGAFLQLRYFPIGDIDLETDFYADLVIAARNLAEGRFSVHDFAWKGPVYAFLLVPVRAIVGDWYHAAVVLSALCGGAALALAYRLVLRLFDRRTAVVTTIAASLVVEFFVQSHRASTDVLFLLVCTGSIACTLLARGALRGFAAAGALAAIATLTRYNGIFLAGGTAAVLAVVNPDRVGWRGRVRAFGVYAATFLLVCAPWLLVNWQETERLLMTRNTETITRTFFAAPRWEGEIAAHDGSLLALVGAHPVDFVGQFGRNLMEHVRKDLTQLLGWPLAVLPIVGVLGLALRPPSRRQASLYLFGVVYWFCMGIVFYTPRFFLPMALVYLVLGFSLLRREGTPARLGRLLFAPLQAREPWVTGITVGLLLTVVAVQAPRIVETERALYARRPLDILQAARHLAKREEHTRARIMARKGHIAYHAGFDLSLYSTSVSSLEELVRLARAEGADYIAYSRVEYSMLPRMLFFAVTDTVPMLQEVYRGPGVRVFRPDAGRTTLTDVERHALLLSTLGAARQQRRPAVIYTALVDLGMHHMASREFEDAAVRLREAVEVAENAAGEADLAWDAAVARLHLADAEMALGHAEAVIPMLQESRRYFAAQGAERDVSRTDAMLQRARRALGPARDR